MPHPYTTPTYLARISGADLTGARIVLTLKQGRTALNVEDFDSREDAEDATTVEFTLSQVESARFRDGFPIEVQANAIDSNGYRVASDIGSLHLKRQILREVLDA